MALSAADLFACFAPQCTGPCKDTWLELAELWVNACCFGALSPMAVATVAAHLCTMFPEAGPVNPQAGGPITSLREGDTAINFGFLQQTAQGDMFWTSTPYGQQWLAMQAASACSAPFLAKP